MKRAKFADPGERRELNRSIVTHWIAVRHFMDLGLGDSAVGYVALEAFYSDRPEVTAEYVSERLDGIMGEDTARRRLHKMHRMGVLDCRKVGRTLRYQLKWEIAKAAMAVMHGEA